jgi:fused signal recognition particle receptor
MKDQVKRNDLGDSEILRKVLRDTITDTLKKNESPLHIPKNELFTIMVVGVNGTGKTTTIGKLAHTLKKDGTSVMLVAADTFRAAAIEQLEVWSQRVAAPLIKQKTGADPSAVVFDAIVAAKARKADALIIDTAGRLHTKVNLMEELKKMKRIIERELPGAPHEILLVLDATTGQNAVVQAKMFNDEIGVTGIILTKLDGTAKGGVIIGIARELSIPIRYIGIGERLDDLKSFNSTEFVDALFEQDTR